MRVAVAALAYPVLWLVFTLIRGASVGWYPYPFVNVDQLGYGGVLWRGAVMLIAFTAAAAALAAIGNRQAKATRTYA